MGATETLVHDIAPRHEGGSYRWGVRRGATAAIVSAPTDASPDRIHTEQFGTAKRAISFSRAKTLPGKTIEILMEALPRYPMPAARLPTGLRTRQYLLDELTVVGGQRVTARLDDGGSELLLSTSDGPASFRLRMRGAPGTALSRPRRLTVESGRTLRVRPSDWTMDGLNTAPLPVQVRATPDGPPVRCFEVAPEGPVEQ